MKESAQDHQPFCQQLCNLWRICTRTLLLETLGVLRLSTPKDYPDISQIRDALGTRMRHKPTLASLESHCNKELPDNQTNVWRSDSWYRASSSLFSHQPQHGRRDLERSEQTQEEWLVQNRVPTQLLASQELAMMLRTFVIRSYECFSLNITLLKNRTTTLQVSNSHNSK